MKNRRPELLLKKTVRRIEYGIEHSIKSLGVNRPEESAWWLKYAATVAWNSHPGYFVDMRMERLLFEIADKVGQLNTRPRAQSSPSRSTNSESRILHLLTKAYHSGGHTRAVARWIDNCHLTLTDQVHNVLITQQGDVNAPRWLASAAERTGGICEEIPPGTSFKDQIERIALSCDEVADAIVMHHHPNDPFPAIGFLSSSRRCPVLMFNHADHVFSLGTSVADVILDFRKSGQAISVKRRMCAEKSILLPIPLSDLTGDLGDVLSKNRSLLRKEARQRIGVSAESKVMLTIGGEYKYKPALGLDFSRTAESILTRSKDAHLFAIGLPDAGRWRELSRRVDGRFHPIGRFIEDINDYFLAADVYLEGFPFSSLTAMLEAALFSVPVQRLIDDRVPILFGDDISLDSVAQAARSEEDYIENAIKLLESPEEVGNRVGSILRERVLSDHCGKTWVNNYLEPAMKIAMKSASVADRIKIDQKSNQTWAQDPPQGYDLLIALVRAEHHPESSATLWSITTMEEIPRRLKIRLLMKSIRDFEPLRSGQGCRHFINILLPNNYLVARISEFMNH